MTQRGSVSDQERTKKAKAPKSKDDGAKPALLLFGDDFSAEDIVDAIKVESKRQLATDNIGRRNLRMPPKDLH